MNCKIEELIKTAKKNIEMANESMTSLNDVLNKLSAINHIQTIVENNEEYKKDLQYIESKIIELLDNIGGEK